MQSDRIKMAAAGVVTAGSLVAGVGVAQAAVPSLSNSSSATNLPTSGPALTAEVLSDGAVLVQGTGFNANAQLAVVLDDGTGREIAEYPTAGANGNFVTEFPAWFVGSCFPSGVTIFANISSHVSTNSIAVPGAGCAVPPTGGGGGTGGSGNNLTQHIHYQ
jgi:hypothetical protein